MKESFFLNLAILLLLAYTIGKIFEKIKVPKIIGYLLVGIIFGPTLLDLVNPTLLNISAYMRKIALIIILMRSGLALNFSEIKKIGFRGILMSFVPAGFEILACLIFAPLILKVDYLTAGIMGCVLAAVSPAIVVPRMLKLKSEGYGTKNNVPQTVMAGSSLDDIFVIIVFTILLAIKKSLNDTGEIKVTAAFVLNIPGSIVLGVAAGILIGVVLYNSLKLLKTHANLKLIILLLMAILCVGLEELLHKVGVEFSSLLSIFVIAIIFATYDKENSEKYSQSLKHVWEFFEALLFLLVGLITKIDFKNTDNLKAWGLICVTLVFRSLAVFLCFIRSKTTYKERLFIIFAYLPKATVQASIGAIAFQEGVDPYQLILIVSVISIVFTAPLGAILMDTTYKKLLDKEEKTVAQTA
ncbi:potassium/proton antiporter [Metamycoplasma cloacale]|uniref:Sodium:proton antiporter n=1 Tax=Metamycoplasma cloacale TaxID=92401 RepID=A0A2Z4LMI2_9BACT|nr:cation:proton antiporter [Metamycoplasma cloacale]AWX42979.1 sodium:proton antiporter [Metamycoplasma cloacale]VEU79197.1 potassium/proton antiporter [Metamycoplasma cloacale]